jgi:pimeloyl-ACP methyl ester carboxylesterase
MSTASSATVSIVLVHGGFVDGSSWKDVYHRLRKDGYDVTVVQNHTESLEDDIVAARQAIDTQIKPVILVGHSYGGAVITEAGTHPKVKALVYIAAFAPDKGESVRTLIAERPPDAPVPPFIPYRDGLLFLDREKFRAVFAADVAEDDAAFMADSQVPCGDRALRGMAIESAWRLKPSWYLIATEDHMIPPPTQRAMAERAGATTLEVASSHAVYASQPAAVAAFIEQAARHA